MRASAWIVAVLLSGCAGLPDRGQCEAGDWHGIGERRGQQGRALDADAIREACAKHGVAIDEGLLRAGWVAGTRQHCDPAAVRERAFQGGRSNLSICPADLAPDAEAALYEGQGAAEVWLEVWGYRERIGRIRELGADASSGDRLLAGYAISRIAHDCQQRHRQVATIMQWTPAESADWRVGCGMADSDLQPRATPDPRFEAALQEQLSDWSREREESVAEIRVSREARARLRDYAREQGQDPDAASASDTGRKLLARCEAARERARSLDEALQAWGGIESEPPGGCGPS